MAVDINGTISSFFPSIISALRAQGLTWGAPSRIVILRTFNYPVRAQVPRRRW